MQLYSILLRDILYRHEKIHRSINEKQESNSVRNKDILKLGKTDLKNEDLFKIRHFLVERYNFTN